VRHRRPSSSLTLGIATAVLAVGPLAAATLTHPSVEVSSADSSKPAAISTSVASVSLSSVPDRVVPLRQLTGLNLPDLRLPDLRQFIAPPSSAYLGAHPIAEPAPMPVPVIPGISPTTIDQLGATVKELTRNTPFSLVALTAHDLTGVQARLRARNPDGAWGPWLSTDEVDTTARDHSEQPETVGTDPIFVGQTNAVQLVVTKDAAPITDVDAVLMQPGAALNDDRLADIARPQPGSAVTVISRAQWGADETLRCTDPVYADSLAGAVIHHTSGRNDYTRKQSAGIVRAIYAYQARTLHWCDIGYNVLVDRFGQIFEGRFGGLDRPVQGSHTGGFNDSTIGVGLIGDYRTVGPSPAQITALGRFLGWRLKKAHLDPKGHTTLFSAGSRFTSYAAGTVVDLPVIFGHRDVGDTDCPGDAAYAALDRIRAIAADTAGTPDRGTPTLAATTDPIAQRFTIGTDDIAIVGGKLLLKFLQLGGVVGQLGPPLANAYLVPDGMRQDFQGGSLIVNEVTGFVTEMLKAYTHTDTPATGGPN